MNTDNIPITILSNPNIDMDDTERINELNVLFGEIHKEPDINQTRDYKILVKEINLRIDAEKSLKDKKQYAIDVKHQLEEAKQELEKLQSSI